ncbi:MAG TPA: hypothetical protein VKH64_12955 [Candidatus Binatia bacterium]|nr:hypothetical protein [Candidatus Binatia bacterium]
MKARCVKLWIVAAVLFVSTLCGLKDARADFPLLSPLDMWNVTISGFTVGMGNIQFFDDPTFGKVVAGYIIIKEKAVQNKNGPGVFDLGFFGLFGEWTIDSAGVVSGFLSGGSQAVPLDISFTGKGKDFASISLNGTSTNGAIHMKGVPVSTLFAPPDLTGSWHATTLKNGVASVELFDLTPAADICIDITAPLSCDLTIAAFNLYDLDGTGPGYILLGSVLVSSGSQIGVVVGEFLIDKDTGIPDTTATGRSVTGKLGKKIPLKAGMSGSDDNQAAVKMSMSQ